MVKVGDAGQSESALIFRSHVFDQVVAHRGDGIGVNARNTLQKSIDAAVPPFEARQGMVEIGGI
jgi:hypothetical protein